MKAERITKALMQNIAKQKEMITSERLVSEYLKLQYP
jgi:hypothetical protein